MILGSPSHSPPGRHHRGQTVGRAVFPPTILATHFCLCVLLPSLSCSYQPFWCFTMSTIPACCICSSVLDTIDSKTEKPTIAARHLSCCSRPVCQRCIANNPRYNSYCPYCQISTDPRSTLPQGLRDPPPYNDTQASALPPSEKNQDAPPAYSAHESLQPPSEKAIENAPDVLHFLTPTDTALSLSLAYGVPLHALRKANNVFADHLLQGRRTVVIPGDYYKGGVSLSPRPIEGEEEELRKSKLRRFMVTCKVSE